MERKSINGKKLKMEQSKNQVRHSIAGCLERRRIQAVVRGQIHQPEYLIEELLEDSHPLCIPDYDVLSLAIHGRIFC